MESVEVKEIREDLHKLDLQIVEGFTSLKAGHEAIRKDLENRQATQDKMLSTIYGNGQPGLVTKVANLGQKQAMMWTALGSVTVTAVFFISKYVMTMVT